jgi:hypothetical protein
MEEYRVQITNGSEHRWFAVPFLQPDILFAAMEAQRWAPEAFKLPWNRVSDKSKWKIVVLGNHGERHEEPARVH